MLLQCCEVVDRCVVHAVNSSLNPSYSPPLTCYCSLFLAASYLHHSSSHPVAPGNPPRSLQVPSSLGRSVDLLWYSPVNDSLLGGPVTGYKVRVTNTSTEKTEEHSVPQTVSHSGHPVRFTVGGLKPVTKYAISVAAVNVFGVGVFTSVVMATTKEAGKLMCVVR